MNGHSFAKKLFTEIPAVLTTAFALMAGQDLMPVDPYNG